MNRGRQTQAEWTRLSDADRHMVVVGLSTASPLVLTSVRSCYISVRIASVPLMQTLTRQRENSSSVKLLFAFGVSLRQTSDDTFIFDFIK